VSNIHAFIASTLIITDPQIQATRPPEELTRPPEELTRPPEELKRPPEELKRPPEELTRAVFQKSRRTRAFKRLLKHGGCCREPPKLARRLYL
jgi:hypothetical protein